MNLPAGSILVRVVLLVVAGSLVGCAARLPTYPWTDAPAALSIMARRADSIQTFSSPCTIHVKRTDGYSVSLDGAMAAKIPGWLRIRAWKFGNAVLDVTVTPEGMWVVREGEGAETEPGPPAPGADRIAEAWSFFTGRFFDEPGLRVIDHGGAMFTVERPLGVDGGTVSCEVDRATLTARTYAITDAEGDARMGLTLERYRMVGRTPWPMRLVADMARPPAEVEPRDAGAARVAITFDEAEINPELPAGAFVPPKRAVRQP